MSVDPLADKYPNVTPYLYCNGNPVMLVDPDGRAPWWTIAVGAYYLSARMMENSVGDRDVRTRGYAMQHPINAIRTGSVDIPSWGLSKIASNFQVNLQNNAGFSKGDGGQGNAYRHALWQALLTNNFGDKHAERIGNAHEDVMPKDLSQRSFANLNDADCMADCLNNIIGRQIGNDSQGASNKSIAIKVLREYRNNGLWEVVGNERIGYTLQRSRLSQAQYEEALKVIEAKGNNGLNAD